LIISATQGALGLAPGALVGFSLGLVGGGGSILAAWLLLWRSICWPVTWAYP